ncbi:MAG: hypothetical protein ACFFBL_01225 [Promethearchaeota archaeon]
MINLRLSRLMITIAVWLLLTVVVFGSLIGIAWMSMNATSDVSTDAAVSDVVDEASDVQVPIFYRDERRYHSPALVEEDSISHGFSFIRENRLVSYFPASYIGPPETPIDLFSNRDY